MKILAIFSLFAVSAVSLKSAREPEHELLFKCDRIGGEKCGRLIGFRSCCQPGKCEGTWILTCPDQYQLKDSGL
jgi:hypothetical protein